MALPLAELSSRCRCPIARIGLPRRATRLSPASFPERASVRRRCPAADAYWRSPVSTRASTKRRRRARTQRPLFDVPGVDASPSCASWRRGDRLDDMADPESEPSTVRAAARGDYMVLRGKIACPCQSEARQSARLSLSHGCVGGTALAIEGVVGGVGTPNRVVRAAFPDGDAAR